MKKTLWTKDFTLVTIGTVISTIGGTAMGFALSLVVFDNTGSTWLTGVYTSVMEESGRSGDWYRLGSYHPNRKEISKIYEMDC